MDGADPPISPSRRDGRARPRAADRVALVPRPDVPGLGRRRAHPPPRPARPARRGPGARPGAAADLRRAGRGHPEALSAERLRGSRVRGARVPARGDAGMSAASEVFLRGPRASDRTEFISLMRASRAFHRPWATAPVDDERFDAYL